MKVLLEFMKRVADWLGNDTYHGGVARTDYGIITVAALFEEHCRKKAKPFAYYDARGINEDRRKWFFNEMLECIFSADNVIKWRNVITEPYHLIDTITTPTPDNMPNIYSPLHLMVDALAAKYVWSPIVC